MDKATLKFKIRKIVRKRMALRLTILKSTQMVKPQVKLFYFNADKLKPKISDSLSSWF